MMKCVRCIYRCTCINVYFTVFTVFVFYGKTAISTQKMCVHGCMCLVNSMIHYASYCVVGGWDSIHLSHVVYLSGISFTCILFLSFIIHWFNTSCVRKILPRSYCIGWRTSWLIYEKLLKVCRQNNSLFFFDLENIPLFPMSFLCEISEWMTNDFSFISYHKTFE